MSSKIKIPKGVSIPKNVPKFVAPLKPGEILQFNLEDKKKSILKEQEIFEGGEKDQTTRLKAVQARAKKSRDMYIKNKSK